MAKATRKAWLHPDGSPCPEGSREISALALGTCGRRLETIANMIPRKGCHSITPSTPQLYSWIKCRTLASTFLVLPASGQEWNAAQYVGRRDPSPYLSGNLEPAKVIRVL